MTPLTSRLKELLENRKFVVTAEAGPPRGSDHTLLVENIHAMKDYCDAINITDNVRGIPTMSSMVCSRFVIEAGAEPVMQVSARDRNRVLLQSELFGAYSLGVRNVLFVTGDHTILGPHPQTKMVFDFDSVQALQIASHIMSGKDLSGTNLEGVPEFYLGATFNPYADPLEVHAWRVEKKSKSGARFFQSQAVYDVSRFEQFMEQIQHVDAGVLAGIIPLKGAKMAAFMNKTIPGMKIPAEIIKRLETAGDGLKGDEKRDAVRKEGLKISLETIGAVRRIKGVDGIHIMGVGWEESVPELVRGAGLYPRPK